MAKKKDPKPGRIYTSWNGDDRNKLFKENLDDRKAYAGKVRLAIEKRNRSLKKLRKANALKVLSTNTNEEILVPLREIANCSPSYKSSDIESKSEASLQTNDEVVYKSPDEEYCWSESQWSYASHYNSSVCCASCTCYTQHWKLADFYETVPPPVSFQSSGNEVQSENSAVHSETSSCESKDQRREELNSDWESVDNVSLGLIYVPMEEQESTAPLSVEAPESQIAVTEDDSDQDVLSSIETFIFEPKESFPLTIGRNNNLRASISISQIDDWDDSSGDSDDVPYDSLGSYSQKPPQSASDSRIFDRRESNSCHNVSLQEASTTSWQYVNGRNWEQICSTEPSEDIRQRDHHQLTENSHAKSSTLDDLKKKLVVDLKNKLHLMKKQQNSLPSTDARDPSVLDPSSSWSDLESLIFADVSLTSRLSSSSCENSYFSSSISYTSPLFGKKHTPPVRMDAYRDDWLFWDQQRKMHKPRQCSQLPPSPWRRSSLVLPNGNSTWKVKARRMLLWMHHTHATVAEGSCYQWSWWKAKQRASVLWLTAKANNCKVPDDLKEPYYKDHDDQDQLKPVIIHALASAEYYCLALGNIYADPNYHNLNHWGVIQVLARKGVYIAEPSDVALTETVLIQTSPIKMSAHMAVIEAMMALYIKETVTTERIVHAIKRFTSFSASNELPADTEEALILWINKACVKMKHRIEEETNSNDPEIQKSGEYLERAPPSIPILHDLSDLNDGCCIATLITFYCPDALKWQDICYNTPMSMTDSLYNLQLVQRFCREHLPFNPCFLTLEDLVYQHSSVRQNILAFLADLFFLFEIKPAKCVRVLGSRSELVLPFEAQPHWNGRGQVGTPTGKRSFQQPVSPIPDLRSNSYSSMPDINRISPRSHISPQQASKDSTFPRRQSSQPESRTLERTKRYSFHEAPKNQVAQSSSVVRTHGKDESGNGENSSIRRTHSLLDIANSKSQTESHPCGFQMQGESRFQGDIDSEPEVYYVHRSFGITSPLSTVAPDDPRLSGGLDENDEPYHRVGDPVDDDIHISYEFDEKEDKCIRSPRGPIDEERLMPARLRPSKEKANHDTKVEERGEYDRRGSSSTHASPGSPRLRHSYSRRSSVDEVKEIRSRHSSGKGEIGVIKVNSDPFSISNKYSIEGCKEANIPIVHDDYKHFPDNREVEEHLTNARIGKTSIYVPSEGSTKPQYIFLTTSDKDKGLKIEDSKINVNTTSFAQLSKLRDHQGSGINIVYMQQDRDHGFDGNNMHPLKSSFLQKRSGSDKKTTTFAALPNQTTWQQQGATSEASNPMSTVHMSHEAPLDGGSDPPLATQLHNVRLKLEEKRRRIELEKRKMELMLNRARQKVGKAAFLQAVSKSGSKGSGRNTPDSGASGDLGSPTDISESRIPQEIASTTPSTLTSTVSSAGKTYTMQEIAEELTSVQHKWLDNQSSSMETLSGSEVDRPSPDLDGVTYEEYTRSLERLNTNLSDLQVDIQRLSNQQEQIQCLMRNGMAHSSQPAYFVQTEPSTRQQWAIPERDSIYPLQIQVSSAQRLRPQWGPTVIPVGSDLSAGSVQVPVCPPLLQQRMNAPSPVPYGYVDPHGRINYSTQSDGFSLHTQHPVSVQNGSSAEQYSSPYGQYTMSQFPTQVSYQSVPSSADMYNRFGSAQTSPAPFRLHVEAPPHLTQQQQPQSQIPSSSQHTTPPQQQVMYQRPPSMSSPIPRPTSIHTSPLPSKSLSVQAPPESYMEPQAVHFIETVDNDSAIPTEGRQDLPKAISGMDSFSGTATYCVRETSSPTRPLLSRTFRVPKPKVLTPTQTQAVSYDNEQTSEAVAPSGRESSESDKGFFVAFDDIQPKRSKPPLRTKKVPRITHRSDRLSGLGSQFSSMDSESDSASAAQTPTKSSGPEASILSSHEHHPSGLTESEMMNNLKLESSGDDELMASRVLVDSPGVGFVIGAEELDADPLMEDEMAKKRERILLNALRRKEEQETVRAQKEQEAILRREQERLKQELIEKKKEDERARRQAILDQYKQRKALEDQENEKVDTSSKTSTLPKTKARHMKQRPKSLHESALPSSERSSTLNLSSTGSRGSQQNLAGPGSDTSSSLSFRYGDTDSGLGRNTPPRRAPSPGHAPYYRHPLSPSSGPPSLPPGLVSRHGGPISDTASDTCSTTSSTLEYTGPKLFKQPAAKSNRGIIINAINSVLAGAVNQETKKRALEEIARSDSKHFLILFRDSGCQFRALYSFSPEKEEVFKLFGTGPRQVSEQMIDRYYKYNSGGKSFMEIQTKHLTVTIDAFTIHNSLWQGKKAVLPRKDYF